MMGLASNWAAVTAPWLADAAMPTRFSAGFLDVGDVTERRGSGNDHVGVQCERQHRIHGRWPAGRNDDLPSQHGVVDQPEGKLCTAHRHHLESVGASAIADRGQFGGAG